PFSRSIDYPHQLVVHHSAYAKVWWDGQRLGHWAWQTTFQADNRRENRIRRLNHSDIPTVSLHLRSLQNALSWHKVYGPWKSEAGLQLLTTNNSNERGTGVVPIIPNYTEVALGGYGIKKYQREHWGAEAGVRFDGQRTEADGYDWTGRRYGGRRQFGNFTYSLGAHFSPSPHWRLTTNVGLAWRAPHVYELYSNGNELGSGMFVRGDSTLQSERSCKWVTSIDYHSRRFRVRLDAYLQWISHYIYDQPTGRNIVVVSGAYPVFQYRQTPAFFRGIDLDLRFRPWPTIDYHVVTALIWANEQTTGNYLPYIPSPRIYQSLSWMPAPMGRWQPRVGVNHRFVARQTRFNPATDLIPFTPEAYHLLGFEAGVTYRLPHGQSLQASVMGDNVLNKEYKEYTNRSRYYAHDMGRDIRCTVTWNF
ncbi:MAG: TonB-dependent receptor, partial [Prevotella sp.]|nr:TonB-dependent receptor [Prevotella sp.]